MIFGNKYLNLLAKTLDAILEITLLRLMGYNWVILVGFLIFGLSTTCFSLKFGGIILGPKLMFALGN